MEQNELNDENCDSDVQYCKKPEPNPNYKKIVFFMTFQLNPGHIVTFTSKFWYIFYFYS